MKPDKKFKSYQGHTEKQYEDSMRVFVYSMFAIVILLGLTYILT